MFRSIGKTLFLALLTFGVGIGTIAYVRHNSMESRLRASEAKNEELKQFVNRLSEERRVANIIVTDSDTVGSVRHTTLLFVEFTKNGRELPAKRFTIEGNQAHIDALVIKFDRDFVKKNDPLRGHSIALFHRIFGDKQRPEDGALIDPPGTIPAVYQDADPKVSAFERGLWDSFWQLTTDKALREEKGVRVATAQSVWGPFVPGRLYTVTLESAGGLSLVSEPLKSIYREALQDRK
jgi:hypothetical protein